MFEIHAHADARAFLDVVTPHLGAEEARNNLLLGLGDAIAGGRKYGEEAPALLTVERDGSFAGAALRAPPHKVILSPMDVSCAEALADWHRQRGNAVPGVHAERAVATAFARAYLPDGVTHATAARNRIYELKELQVVPTPPGSARVAVDQDRELVRRWSVDFHDEAIPHSPRSPQAMLGIDMQLDRGRWLLWVDPNGEPVCMAVRNRQLPNGESVGPVYTPPALRGRGYATALVAELTRMILADGRRYACLFTDLDNPVSNSIYPKVGYRPVCDTVELHWSVSLAAAAVDPEAPFTLP